MNTGLTILAIFFFISAGITALEPLEKEPQQETTETIADTSGYITYVYKVNGEVMVDRILIIAKEKGAEAPIQMQDKTNQ